MQKLFSKAAEILDREGLLQCSVVGSDELKGAKESILHFTEGCPWPEENPYWGRQTPPPRPLLGLNKRGGGEESSKDFA